MTLKLKLPCLGEEHEILVKAEDEFSDDFEVELPNHDREYDTAFAAMGGDWPECYKFEKDLDHGIDGIFGNSLLRKAFLKALGEQGVDVLGMDENELAERLVSAIEDPLRRGERWQYEVVDSLNELHQFLPWFEKTSEFKHAVDELARMSYDKGDDGVFGALSEMAGGGLITVKEIDEDGDWGEGHVINRATIKVMIGDAQVDQWTFGYVGWFSSIEQLRWIVDREEGSGASSAATDEFLKAAGMDLDEILDNYKPDAPELPKRWKTGRWAIVHETSWRDDDFCGYFKSEQEAREMYEIAKDIIIVTQNNCRGSLGVKLIHRTNKSKAKDFDTWEVLEED